MSTRPAPGRDAAADPQRDAILAATHTLLAEPRTGSAFSLDAVAARAGVARALMQQRFGSAAHLLAAFWDDLFSRGCSVHVPRALQHEDPRAALGELIAIYGAFWHTERTVVRRLRAHAALDPELERALGTRERERREGLQRVAKRLALDAPRADPALAPAELLCMLTSFEVVDALAGPERAIAESVPLLQSFASLLLDRA